MYDPNIHVIVERGRMMFNGTPDECKDWLNEVTLGPEANVWVVNQSGDDTIPIPMNEYLKQSSQE